VGRVTNLTSAVGKHIAIIQGHPDPAGRHFCHALAQAYAAGARETGHDVEFIDVGTLEFPLLRSRADLEGGAVPRAVQDAQAALRRADHVVMIFPVWNGGMPALLKGFLEQTFRASFMFPNAKPGEALGFSSYFTQKKALAGKTARVITTMQMPAFVYRFCFHPHPERNTLSLSGLGPVRETLIGRVESPNGRKREQWLKKMDRLGRDGR
jgi:putative NADPH-quinone reductase